jgi:hypothetical protein
MSAGIKQAWRKHTAKCRFKAAQLPPTAQALFVRACLLCAFLVAACPGQHFFKLYKLKKCAERLGRNQSKRVFLS